MDEERAGCTRCSNVLQAWQGFYSSSHCWLWRDEDFYLLLEILMGWIISQHHLLVAPVVSPSDIWPSNSNKKGQINRGLTCRCFIIHSDSERLKSVMCNMFMIIAAVIPDCPIRHTEKQGRHRVSWDYGYSIILYEIEDFGLGFNIATPLLF